MNKDLWCSLPHLTQKNLAKQSGMSLFRITLFIILMLGIPLAALEQLLFQHAPLSDDLSMIAFSKTWDWDWINKGLADYFIVYPEYYGAQSNFVRPVSNFVYWSFQAALPFDAPFFANQIQLVVLTFGMLIAISFLTYNLVSRVQDSRIVSFVSGISCLLIPTFWTTPTPTYTSFVFDGLSIAFCLIALIAISKGHTLLMAIPIGLALMTKEISVPAIFGFFLFFAISNKRAALTGCLFAIMFWVLLRWNAFGLHAEGVYVFGETASTISAIFFEKLRNALTLPFGPVFYEEILAPAGIDLFNRSACLLILNILAYGMFAMGTWKFFPSFFRSRSSIIPQSGIDHEIKQTIVGIAFFASLFGFAFDVYVGANYRYAFNLLPFYLIFLAGVIHSPSLKRNSFIIFLAASTIASAPSILRLRSHSEYELFRYRVMRELFEELRQHQDKNRITIVNDFVLGYANPKALEILVPSRSEIMRGTSLYLDTCKLEELRSIDTQIANSTYKLQILTTLPDCARFAFESSPKLAEFVSGTTIRRNENINYDFVPSPSASYLLIPNWSGRNLTASITGSDVLYYDFKVDRWIYVPVENP